MPLSEAKKERIDTQYYIETTAKGGDVEDLIRPAEHFNLILLDALDRITNEKIRKYREKFQVAME
jgi:hypothetical protein